MRRRRPTVYLFLAAVFFIGAVIADMILPHQHLMWRPLDPHAPIGAATRTQVLRLSLSSSQTCSDMAEGTSELISWPADANGLDHPVCGWRIARHVEGRGSITLKPQAPRMQCPLAIGAHIWMGEVDRLARDIWGVALSHIEHFGTYSCRRQRGNGSRAWSEHAFANAWDISAFVLSDGRRISVRTDWNGTDKSARQFLRGARNKACRVFRVTLSPDYNTAHHDHFHLDMGPTSTCR